MKCMYKDHVGPEVGIQFVFVPKQVADNGHPKIEGPLICINCYHKEFGHCGFLPQDVWVDTTDGPMLLADIMSVAVPDSATDSEFEERLKELRKSPAWSADQFRRRMRHYEVQAKKELRRKDYYLTHVRWGRGYGPNNPL